ncbi:MAG: hypothetical protein AMJ45_02560 [Syntrophobacter sp. DG_60]|nr:MAG: hypothetical protein AMJ45_02560 [Syntrophobacter sp. DG_60]
MWQQFDPSLVKKLKAKMEQELGKKELESIQYWLEEIEKLYKRHQDMIGLQNALKELTQRMKNRIKVLKSSL